MLSQEGPPGSKMWCQQNLAPHFGSILGDQKVGLGGPQTDLWESINEQFVGTLRAQNLRCKNKYGITLRYRIWRMQINGGRGLLTQGGD